MSNEEMNRDQEIMIELWEEWQEDKLNHTPENEQNKKMLHDLIERYYKTAGIEKLPEDSPLFLMFYTFCGGVETILQRLSEQ